MGRTQDIVGSGNAPAQTTWFSSSSSLFFRFVICNIFFVNQIKDLEIHTRFIFSCGGSACLLVQRHATWSNGSNTQHMNTTLTPSATGWYKQPKENVKKKGSSNHHRPQHEAERKTMCRGSVFWEVPCTRRSLDDMHTTLKSNGVGVLSSLHPMAAAAYRP